MVYSIFSFGVAHVYYLPCVHHQTPDSDQQRILWCLEACTLSSSDCIVAHHYLLAYTWKMRDSQLCLEGLVGCLTCNKGPEVIKPLSCSTQLSMKFFLPINAEMPTTVGISTFKGRKNSILSLSQPENS